MRKMIWVATTTTFVISCVLFGPADFMAKAMLGLAGAFLCGALLWTLSRCGFVKSSSGSVQKVLCLLVCVVSVVLVGLFDYWR